MHSPGLDALVKASRTVNGPTVEARERNRQRLTAQIAAGVATVGLAAGARASSALAGSIAKWSVVSILISAAVAIGVGTYVTRSRVSTLPIQTAPSFMESPVPAILAGGSMASPRPTATPGLPMEDGARGAVLPAEPAGAQAPAPARSGTELHPRQGSSPGPGSAVVDERNLERELQLLRAARRAIDAGSPAPALALLDRYADEFPHGALKAEYQTARVLALCAAGRVASARQAKDEFIEQQPGSPLAERLRATCAGGR
jgi:hypothetical protein